MSMDDARAAARRGIAFLDSHPKIPRDWRSLVNRESLDMSCDSQDVPAHIGRKTPGMKNTSCAILSHDLGISDADSITYGFIIGPSMSAFFSYELLTQAWLEALPERDPHTEYRPGDVWYRIDSSQVVTVAGTWREEGTDTLYVVLHFGRTQSTSPIMKPADQFRAQYTRTVVVTPGFLYYSAREDSHYAHLRDTEHVMRITDAFVEGCTPVDVPSDLVRVTDSNSPRLLLPACGDDTEN